jgi:hypothetical protein
VNLNKGSFAMQSPLGMTKIHVDVKLPRWSLGEISVSDEFNTCGDDWTS